MSSNSFEDRFGRPPKPPTQLTSLGRNPDKQHGFVNTPIYRGSTVLFPTLEALTEYKQEYTYGRRGTPTTQQLESAISTLENGHRTFLTPSGYAAVTSAILAFASPGDHILVVDSVYQPARRFCDTVLARLGVETTYYDPLVGGAIDTLIRPNTRLIFAESPGSNTFEVQDIPAIAAVARASGVWLMMDNTWATPLYFRPLDHGVDVSIQSGTKYLTGHADTMLGLITTSERATPIMSAFYDHFGLCASPEDCFLALRGMRTMGVRLERHWSSGLEVAGWLWQRPEVAQVLHPAMPGDKGYDLWRRDFKGASGLFAIVLQPVSRSALAAMLDGLSLFGMGYSWGGYESLVVPFNPRTSRTATLWPDEGPALRIHIGLEDVADLTADLEAGFKRLTTAEPSA